MTNRGFFWIAGALGVAAAALARPGAAGAAASEESMKVELGRRLFFDPAVGRRGRVGCAECHQPENGFSDPRARSQDEDRELPRHSQPVTDVAGEGFHWDGEFATVRDLIDSRVLPIAEARSIAAARTALRVAEATRAGHPPKTGEAAPAPRFDGYAGGGGFDFSAFAAATPVAVRLRQDGRYDEGFRLAYGDASITPQRVGEAIDAYVRSLRTSENGLDRFAKGDAAALSDAAQRGLSLFRGKAGCAQCHLLEAKDGRAALTDGKFHDTGVAFRTESRSKTVLRPGADRNLSVRAETGPDTGRAGATFLPGDTGSFKTPSLRDVAKRAPYMHDGSFATLAEVVDYYDRGGTPNEHLDARIRPLSLTPADRADLVEFLVSLTGSERPGLGGVPEYRKATLRVRVEDLGGKPVKDLAVRVVPCGDRLRGTEAMPEPFEVRTDADGGADVALPKATHVRLEADGFELGLSRPIPDWVASTTLLATPKSAISVRVRKSAALRELPAWFEVQRAMPEFQFESGRGSDQALKLTRVRNLSGDEAIYTLNAPTDRHRTVVSLVLAGVQDPLGTFEIDLAGGMSETIDLGAAEKLRPEAEIAPGDARVIRVELPGRK